MSEEKFEVFMYSARLYFIRKMKKTENKYTYVK